MTKISDLPTAKYNLLTDLVLSPLLRKTSAVMPPKGPERDFTKKGVAARNPICGLTMNTKLIWINVCFLVTTHLPLPKPNINTYF